MWYCDNGHPGRPYGQPCQDCIDAELASPRSNGRRIINGCPVVFEANGYSVIDHPTGYQVYAPDGWRVAYTYKTLAGAARRTER